MMMYKKIHTLKQIRIQIKSTNNNKMHEHLLTNKFGISVQQTESTKNKAYQLTDISNIKYID